MFLDSYTFLHKGLSDIPKSLHWDDFKILKQHYNAEVVKNQYFFHMINMHSIGFQTQHVNVSNNFVFYSAANVINAAGAITT